MVTTGPQLRPSWVALGWSPKRLAEHAKVPVSVVLRAESSPDDPAVTIAQLNALMQALRAASASFPAAEPDAGTP